jgi:hypothetical protein
MQSRSGQVQTSPGGTPGGWRTGAGAPAPEDEPAHHSRVGSSNRIMKRLP